MPRDHDYYLNMANRQIRAAAAPAKPTPSPPTEETTKEPEATLKTLSPPAEVKTVTSEGGDEENEEPNISKPIDQSSSETTNVKVEDEEASSPPKPQRQETEVGEVALAPVELILDSTLPPENPPHLDLLLLQSTRTDSDSIPNPLLPIPQTTSSEPFKIHQTLHIRFTASTSATPLNLGSITSHLLAQYPRLTLKTLHMTPTTCTSTIQTDKPGPRVLLKLNGKRFVSEGCVWTVQIIRGDRVHGNSWYKGSTTSTSTSPDLNSPDDDKGEEEGEEGAAEKNLQGSSYYSRLPDYSEYLASLRPLLKTPFTTMLDELSDSVDMSLIMRAWLSRGEMGFVQEEETKYSSEEEKGGERKYSDSSDDEGKSDSDSDSSTSSSSSSSSTSSLSSRTDLQIYRSSLSAQTTFTPPPPSITYFNIVKMLSLIFPRGDVDIIQVTHTLRLLGHIKSEKVLTSNHINYIDLYASPAKDTSNQPSSKPYLPPNHNVLRWKWLVGKRLEGEKTIKKIEYDIFIRLCYMIHSSPTPLK
ncbi:hypothetical protein TrST_g169 [Triparma strigata]|uniref:Uncharacterized protein n=1 Tax=Triparma strigata TaxID=1606541 RepID=A0A9W7BWP4_9STRA|nr:hypothetical protein TrST_g169 [Triparma strigata]